MAVTTTTPAETTIPKASTKAKVKACIAALIVCLGGVGVGTCVGYPSPAVPDINAHPNPFFVNSDEQSWIGGIVCLGSMVGAAISGLLMDALGRKLALMVTSVPFTIGWIIIVASPNIGVFYFGRFVSGFSKGIALGIVPVYISEIAPAEIRGLLGAFNEMSCLFGMLYAYSFGYFLHWTWLAIACSAVIVVMVVALFFMPETPRWFLSKGRKDDAIQAMYWLRGKNANIFVELEEMEKSITVAKDVVAWKEFLKPTLLKPLIICILMFALQQLCGNNVIKVYTTSIFQATNSKMDSSLETIIVGIVGVCGTLTCVLTVDLVGRRILLIISTVMMTLSMAAIGAYFKVQAVHPSYAQDNLDWLPLLSLVSDNYFYALGCGPISWTLSTELFSTRARGRANSIAVGFEGLFSFICTKCFVYLTNAIELYGGFWVCAGISAVGIFFVIFVVPETKGKTLEELQRDHADVKTSDAKA